MSLTPSLSLCLIVRDEVERLGACLASAAGIADEIIVVDTGSRDGTPAIARELGATVYHLAWADDFSAARNHGLERAGGDWLLCLDADERIQAGDGPRLRQLLLDEAVEGYYLLLWNHFTDDPERGLAPHLTLRLFRNRPGYRFTGRVHETIDPAVLRASRESFRVTSDVRLHHYGYRPGDPSLLARAARNLALMEREAEKRPDDPLVLFNLGTEYFRLGRHAEALAHYDLASATAPPGAAFLPTLVRNKVVSCIQRGLLDRAKAEIRRGLRDRPDFGELYYMWALICQMEGEYTQALHCLTECLRLGRPPLHYGSIDGLDGYRTRLVMAHCHRRLGAPGSAARELIEALAAGAPLDDDLAGCLAADLRQVPEEERRQLVARLQAALQDPGPLPRLSDRADTDGGTGRL